MPAYLRKKFLAEEEVCAVLVLVIWVNTPETISFFQMTHVFWIFAEPHHWFSWQGTVDEWAVSDIGEVQYYPKAVCARKARCQGRWFLQEPNLLAFPG